MLVWNIVLGSKKCQSIGFGRIIITSMAPMGCKWPSWTLNPWRWRDAFTEGKSWRGRRRNAAFIRCLVMPVEWCWVSFISVQPWLSVESFVSVTESAQSALPGRPGIEEITVYSMKTPLRGRRGCSVTWKFQTLGVSFHGPACYSTPPTPSFFCIFPLSCGWCVGRLCSQQRV